MIAQLTSNFLSVPFFGGVSVFQLSIDTFPKWESLKNKSGKSGMFFEPEKRPSMHQHFTSNPPQIHHQKTTFIARIMQRQLN
jgi:hypothetical protein